MVSSGAETDGVTPFLPEQVMGLFGLSSVLVNSTAKMFILSLGYHPPPLVGHPERPLSPSPRDATDHPCHMLHV